MPIIFPWKHVWKVKVSRRVSFFVWIAVWDRIFTGDNLRGRMMDCVDWCIMCRCNGETVDHLLLHYGKAYQLWSLVFRSFGSLGSCQDRLRILFLGGGIGMESICLVSGI